MTVDEYLDKCLHLRRRVDIRKEKYISLYEQATSAGPVINETGTRSSNRNAREDLLAKLADAREEFAGEALDFLDYEERLFALFGELPDNEADVLTMRYIGRKTVEEMRKTYKTHGREICTCMLFKYLKRGKEDFRKLLKGRGVKVD